MPSRDKVYTYVLEKITPEVIPVMGKKIKILKTPMLIIMALVFWILNIILLAIMETTYQILKIMMMITIVAQ